MSIPPRLAGKLNDVLGADAAEDLVNWMDEMRADHAELRQEVHAVRAELALLSRTMDEKFNAMIARFDKQDAKFDRQDAKFDKLDEKLEKLNDKFERLLATTSGVGQRLEHLRGHFIAWNAAFWLTAVTAIVALLQFLQR